MTNIDHKRLAREIDRRRARRRLLTFIVLMGAAIAALFYLRCGKGWGTGGKREADGPKGIAALPDAGPTRCALRLTATGLTLDGKPTTREAAIAACKRTTGADVLISGDARQGDWDALRGALEAASIEFFTREPRGIAPADAGSP